MRYSGNICQLHFKPHAKWLFSFSIIKIESFFMEIPEFSIHAASFKNKQTNKQTKTTATKNSTKLNSLIFQFYSVVFVKGYISQTKNE